MNRDMQKALDNGEAIDVRSIGTEVRPGVFELRPGSFKDDVDYFDGEKEHWIWSIGVHESTGKTYASVTSEFYEDSAYRCLWLR